MNNKAFKHFTLNKEGRDFVVGDLHGMFHTLETLLEDVEFDTSRDRLFSVGDLIDRGPQSDRVTEFLDYPWFYSIMGNHEKMLLEAEHDSNMYRSWTTNNGGEWWIDIPEKVQRQIRKSLSKLPIAMEVRTNSGKIGMVHADLPLGMPWNQFVTMLQEDDELCNYVLWSRNRYRHFKITNSMERVEDVDLVILGHTPVQHPIHVSNICYLDTGAAYETKKGLGKLSVLEIQPNLRLYQQSTAKKRFWLA